MFVHSFDTKSAPRVSRRPFDLESSNLIETYIPTLSTAILDITALGGISRERFKLGS